VGRLFGRKRRRGGTPHGLKRHSVRSKTLNTSYLTLQKEGENNVPLLMIERNPKT